MAMAMTEVQAMVKVKAIVKVIMIRTMLMIKGNSKRDSNSILVLCTFLLCFAEQTVTII